MTETLFYRNFERFGDRWIPWMDARGAFGTPECIKCGAMRNSMDFKYKIMALYTPNKERNLDYIQVSKVEMLEIKCTFCGFSWNEFPKDSDGVVDE